MQDLTDQELVDAFLTWLGGAQRRSPRTVRCYRNVLKLYLEWLDKPLSEVRIDDVEAFGARSGRAKVEAQAAAATVRKDVVIIRLFHRWASERDYPFRRVDTIAVPRVPHAAPKPIDDDVWRRLWGSDLSDHDRLWLGLGYFAGLRRAEIVTIPPSGVRGSMLVFQRKGGGIFPVDWLSLVEVYKQELPQLCDGVDAWVSIVKEEATTRLAMDALFLWYDAEGHMENDGNRLNKRLDKRLLPQLGLPPHSVTPHRLRHSCATNLLRAGLLPEFVQKQLSHSSVDITMRYMEMSGEMARWWARERGTVI